MHRALIVLAVAALTVRTVSGDSAMTNEHQSQLRGGAKDTANKSSRDARGATFDDLGSDVTLHPTAQVIGSSMGAEGALGKSQMDGNPSGETPCSDDDSDDDSDDSQQSDTYSPEPTPTPSASTLLGDSNVAGHALTKTSAPEVPTDSDDCADPQQSDTYSPEPTTATATPSLGDSNVAGHQVKTTTPTPNATSDTSNGYAKQPYY